MKIAPILRYPSQNRGNASVFVPTKLCRRWEVMFCWPSGWHGLTLKAKGRERKRIPGKYSADDRGQNARTYALQSVCCYCAYESSSSLPGTLVFSKPRNRHQMKVNHISMTPLIVRWLIIFLTSVARPSQPHPTLDSWGCLSRHRRPS